MAQAPGRLHTPRRPSVRSLAGRQPSAHRLELVCGQLILFLPQSRHASPPTEEVRVPWATAAPGRQRDRPRERRVQVRTPSEPPLRPGLHGGP